MACEVFDLERNPLDPLVLRGRHPKIMRFSIVCPTRVEQKHRLKAAQKRAAKAPQPAPVPPADQAAELIRNGGINLATAEMERIYQAFANQGELGPQWTRVDPTPRL